MKDLTREYQLLRDEIWCGIAGVLEGKKEATPTVVLEVVTCIDFVLDTTLAIANEVYEEARRDTR